MKVAIGLTLLVFGLLQVKIQGREHGTLRRALDNLQELGEYKRRGLVDCKALGEDCDRVVPCCGTTQCFWMDGFSMLKRGECVPCVERGEKCQGDGQCCSHLQCDKGNSMWMDGTCEKYRRNGACYRDGQCVKDCKKSWYKTHGECS